MEKKVKKPAIKEDNITLKRIKTLHPLLREEGMKIYKEILSNNIEVRFTNVLRTFAEQGKLYAQGRSTEGRIVTNAGPGQSYHNYGLAIDFCLITNNGKTVSWDRSVDLDRDGKKDWEEVVQVFKKYGWTWGGDWRFKDYPHFQKDFGYNWHELLNLKNAGNVDGEGYVIIKNDEIYH